MNKFLASLLILIGLGTAVRAQVYNGPPQPSALVCANNTVVPSPIAGRFYYVQCNSSGQIVIQ